MDIITTARHFELTPAVRQHAEKRLRKLERFLNGIQEIHLIIKKEKYRYVTEVNLRANGANVISRDESADILSSIDRVVDRVERQVKRLRGRVRERSRPRRVEGVAPTREEAEPEEEEEESLEEMELPPVVVPVQENFHPEPISVAEAVEELERREEKVLLFRNSETGLVGMVYVRPDGNIGYTEAD
jgi:putative sigma-54 modulation protein